MAESPPERAYALSEKKRLDFLRHTPPFDQLDPGVQEELAAELVPEKYPAGTVLLAKGKSPITHLRLIYQGRVSLSLKDGAGEVSLSDQRGPGEAIGTLGIILDSLSNLDVIAQQDTVCLLLPREKFVAMLKSDPRLAGFYLRAVAQGYVSKAFTQLERPRSSTGGEGSLYLFSAQMHDVVRRRPEYIVIDASAQEAAKAMSEHRTGYLLVKDQKGRAKGIITDRDLRTKVVGQGRDFTTPVSEIMSAPLSAIPSHTVAFDALLEMMRRRVHHLVIQRNGEITGVVSGHDLMVLQGSSPLYLIREIATQPTIEGLYDLSLKSSRVVRSLINEGAKPGNVTRMITLINDYILDRLLNLLVQEMGPPPVPFCWLLMGSEGRKEQTFRTDQDNGIIYDDPKDQAQADLAKNYFHMLGNEAIRHLVLCGFPKCKGGIMASNPQWCQPYSVWQGYFDRWIRKPEPQEVLNATIFFDFRPGFGTLELGQKLRGHLMEQVKGQDVFLRFLAQNCLATPPAIGFFRNFTLEKDGEHKNKLDMKTKGLVPYVDFARIMSLKCGISETNTLERLTLLGEGEHISAELCARAVQAYEIQMQIRLVHQQQMDDAGQVPNNYIDPRELSELDRQTLKNAFAVTNDIRSFLKESFRLSGG